MSWAQEGRERKNKDLAKAEEYAEKGVGKAKKRVLKRFGMERRHTEAFCAWMGTRHSAIFGTDYREWSPFYAWYETEKRRDQAMETLSKKMFCGNALYYEYRPIER